MPRALITDLSGTAPTEDERLFLSELDPLGVVLFGRNIDNPRQLSDLVSEFRSCVGRDDAPVLIDQEGGRVARLRAPHWWGGVPAASLGTAGPEAARLAARLLARDMSAVGIDVVCAPCLDLRIDGMHAAIGDRSFGADARTVSACGAAFCEGLLEGGVQPMIKHMPGHGRVGVDPHDALPSTSADLRTLREHDFRPFRALNDAPWGMTAHVVYEAIDPDRPATQSPGVIGGVIRGDIGFDGVLTSDAIDMKALSGSHEERALLSLEAGCDVAMHCNQPLAVRRAVAEAAPMLSGDALRRVETAAARRPRPSSGAFDREAALARLGVLLGAG